jgi:hypothetical protein
MMRNLSVILFLIILCGSPAQMSPQTTFPAAKKESKDPENNKLMKIADGNQTQISGMLKNAKSQQKVKPKVVYIKVYSKPTSMAKKKYIPIDDKEFIVVDSSSAVVTQKKSAISITDKPTKAVKVVADSVKIKRSFFYRLFKKIKNI